MNQLREKIHPGLRGALFYAAFWGTVGIFEPFTTLYFVRSGMSGTQIGWLATVLPLCTVAITPLISRLADYTRARVLILAAACLGFGAAITLPSWPGFQPSFWTLVLFMALFSVFRSPIIALADSLIAPMAVRHSLEFGSMRLWGSFAFTLTATGLGFIWQRTGFETMFLAAGLAFLPVVIVALLLEESPRIVHPSEEVRAPVKPNLDPGLVFLLGATFLSLASLFMAGNFGAVYMNQLGGSEMMVGAMMGLAAGGEVPGMLFGSRISRRLGDTNTLLVAYLLGAAGLAGTALTRTPEVVLVFSVLRGLGFGVLLVTTVTIINNRAPLELASTYQGILNAACWGLAPLLGGPISGWIFQNLGASALFLTAAVMTATSGLLILPTYKLWNHSTLRAQVRTEKL